jgi:two-component system NtrC family sensor kinase
MQLYPFPTFARHVSSKQAQAKERNLRGTALQRWEDAMNHEISFERFYRVLRDISSSLNSDTLVKDVLDIVVRKAVDVLDAQGAVIRILNLDTQQFELFAAYGAYGLGERLISQGPVSKKNIIADLCRSKEIVIIRDILNDPRIQYAQEAWSEGFRMALDAPLIVRSDTIGILRVYFSEQREFSEEIINFITIIAEQGAFAIDRAKLIEEQRSRYDQLAIQTEKLSALGRMAAGIAHEINNPLAGILLFSSNLLKKVPKDGPLKEGLELIMQETIRCKRIIQELLEFSREKEPNMIPEDINEIVEKALHILENEFRLRHLTLEKQLMSDLPAILMDKNQIEQVFVNLLLNAMQAVEGQGKITVRSRIIPEKKRIQCEIEDTGCGIPLANMSKIFEPFFSTKAKGTGLGLAVSYGIIQKHHGHIYASGGPGGKGSLFTIEIPIPPNSPFKNEAGKKHES